MLLEASLFWQLLYIGQHRAAKGLVSQKTRLGWVLGGSLTWPVNKGTGTSHCHVATGDNEQLVKQLESSGGFKNRAPLAHLAATIVKNYSNTPPGVIAQAGTSSEFRFAAM